MTPSPPITPRCATVTPRESADLWELRARVRPGQDPWTRPELDRLRFVRWLYRTGRLTS